MKSDPSDQYDGSPTEKMSKPRKRHVSSEGVLQMQHNCLSLQREKQEADTTSPIDNLHLIVRYFVGEGL